MTDTLQGTHLHTHTERRQTSTRDHKQPGIYCSNNSSNVHKSNHCSPCCTSYTSGKGVWVFFSLLLPPGVGNVSSMCVLLCSLSCANRTYQKGEIETTCAHVKRMMIFPSRRRRGAKERGKASRKQGRLHPSLSRVQVKTLIRIWCSAYGWW